MAQITDLQELKSITLLKSKDVSHRTSTERYFFEDGIKYAFDILQKEIENN